MARTTITVGTMTLNAGTVINTVPIDQANGMVILGSATLGVTRKLILYANNTAGSAGTVFAQPGTYPPAFLSQLGTVIVAVGAGTQAWIPLESARVLQSNQDINIDFNVGFTGYVTAYLLPVNI